MFSYEYCEIFKSTYFEEHLRTVASVNCSVLLQGYVLEVILIIMQITFSKDCQKLALVYMLRTLLFLTNTKISRS